MKPIVGYVGVAVVAASVSAFLSRRDTSPSAPYAPRTAETQSALPEKPSAERARAHAVTSRAGAPLDPDEDVAPPSKAVPVADEDDAGDADPVAALDELLGTEATDAAWDAEASGLVQGYFAKAPGSSVLQRMTCSSSMCKLEVRHADEQATTQFVDEVSGFIPRGGHAIIKTGGSPERPETIVFFSRQGHLPI